MVVKQVLMKWNLRLAGLKTSVLCNGLYRLRMASHSCSICVALSKRINKTWYDAHASSCASVNEQKYLIHRLAVLLMNEDDVMVENEAAFEKQSKLAYARFHSCKAEDVDCVCV